MGSIQEYEDNELIISRRDRQEPRSHVSLWGESRGHPRLPLPGGLSLGKAPSETLVAQGQCPDRTVPFPRVPT